eukprot:758954-Hanusia_phi.AAC.1
MQAEAWAANARRESNRPGAALSLKSGAGNSGTIGVVPARDSVLPRRRGGRARTAAPRLAAGLAESE